MFITNGASGSSLNNDIAASTAFTGITYNSGADSFTFSGNGINLAGNISDNAINTETINFPMAMTATRTFIVTNGGNLMVGGVISGTSGSYGITVNKTSAAGNVITPFNTGTMTMNGSAVNTYTGSTIVNGGTLLLDFANLASPVNLINSSSTLALGGMGEGTLSVKGKSSGSTSQTFGNFTLGKGTGSSIVLDPNGGGGTTLTLGNTWNRSGGACSLNIDLSAGGTLASTPSSVANNNVLGFATVKDASGVGLASLYLGNIIRLTGQTTLPASGSGATVNYITSGDVTMSAANFSVNSLTLDASAGSGSLDLAGKTMTITSLGLLMSGANDYTIQNGQVGANGTEVIIHQMGSGSLTINGTVSGTTGGLTKNGAGTLVLGGTNSAAWITINQGTVMQGIANAVGVTNASFTVNYGGTMDLNGYNLGVGAVATSQSGLGIITNSGSLANLTVGNGNNNCSLASALVCGPINVIINGSGAAGLSPANTHTGGTTFQNNTGAVGNYRYNVANEFGTGPLTFNGSGTMQNTASLSPLTNAVVINGSGNGWWLDANTFDVTTGPWSGTGSINILEDATKSPTFTFSNDMSGFQGTLLLSANTNSSATGTVMPYFLSGTSTFDGSHAVWDLYSVLGTVSSLPILQWAGVGSQTIRLGDLNSDGTTGTQIPIVSNSVSGTKATFEVGNLNQNSSFSGALVTGTGDIALTKVGTGTWTLSGNNTYAGDTDINAGSLALSGSGSIASANITVATNAAFKVSGVSGGSYALNPAGTLTLNIAKSGSNLSQGQVLAGANSVTANGTLTVNFSGDALTDGDTFNLFDVQPSGTFTETNLPSLSSSANWYTANNYQTLIYNEWPTAGDPAYTHTKGVQWKVAVADLLTNVTGAISGKTIILTGVGNPGVSGATVQIYGGYVIYTPGPNDANDRFSYSVGDGRGGSATGTIYVNVDTGVASGQMTGAVTSFVGNQANLTFHAISGYSYVTERSTNMTDWIDISTNTAATNGVINVTDTFQDLGGNPPTSAYYRLKY